MLTSQERGAVVGPNVDTLLLMLFPFNFQDSHLSIPDTNWAGNVSFPWWLFLLQPRAPHTEESQRRSLSDGLDKEGQWISRTNYTPTLWGDFRTFVLFLVFWKFMIYLDGSLFHLFISPVVLSTWWIFPIQKTHSLLVGKIPQLPL